MTADIMMVTYNRLDLTRKTLMSLLETTDQPFNLILVDNSSSDESVEFLKDFCLSHSMNKYFYNYKIIINDENKGIAYARNQCLSASTEKWLVTLDNDVTLPFGWLWQCINILEENKDFGAIGVNFENVNYPLIKRGDKEFQEKVQGNLGQACTVFNRNLHKMLGFFDNLKFYAHEDSLWGCRIRKIGLKLGYLKENGIHLGEGPNDIGNYREFKNKYGIENLPIHHRLYQEYMSGKKSVYVDFKD